VSDLRAQDGERGVEYPFFAHGLASGFGAALIVSLHPPLRGFALLVQRSKSLHQAFEGFGDAHLACGRDGASRSFIPGSVEQQRPASRVCSGPAARRRASTWVESSSGIRLGLLANGERLADQRLGEEFIRVNCAAIPPSSSPPSIPPTKKVPLPGSFNEHRLRELLDNRALCSHRNAMVA